MAERRSKPVAEAVAEATRAAERGRSGRGGRSRGRAADVFAGRLRRADVFPLLVLHLIQRGATYGNRLIEEIEEITRGEISVNPNTIYPLLRDLEAEGRIEGRWEHPDRRTRRFYEVTEAGRAEYERLRSELEPVLERAAETIELLRAEIYGPAGNDSPPGGDGGAGGGGAGGGGEGGGGDG